MRIASWSLAALAAAALLAGCGGGDDEETEADTRAATTAPAAPVPPPSRQAEAAVRRAYERLGRTSYRAVLEQYVRYDTSRAPDLEEPLEAAEGTTVTRVESESPERVAAVVDAPQLESDVTVIRYDGETYVAVGPGDVRRLAGGLGDTFAGFADIGIDDLVAGLEEVSALGPGTLDGQAVEGYSAELSDAYFEDLTTRLLSGFSIDRSQVDLSIDATPLRLDLAGRDLVRQTQQLVATIDLTATAGEDAVVVQTGGIDQRFSDIGAPITIERPVSRGEITDLVELGELLQG